LRLADKGKGPVQEEKKEGRDSRRVQSLTLECVTETAMKSRRKKMGRIMVREEKKGTYQFHSLARERKGTSPGRKQETCAGGAPFH